MGLLCGMMGLGLGGFVSSAYRVQVEDGATWKETAENQRQRRLHVEPKRGTIYDRNGAALAASVEVPSVSVDVVEMLRGIEGPARRRSRSSDFSTRIAAALDLDAERRARRSSRRSGASCGSSAASPAEEAQAVRDLGDPKKSAASP